MKGKRARTEGWHDPERECDAFQRIAGVALKDDASVYHMALLDVPDVVLRPAKYQHLTIVLPDDDSRVSLALDRGFVRRVRLRRCRL